MVISVKCEVFLMWTVTKGWLKLLHIFNGIGMTVKNRRYLTVIYILLIILIKLCDFDSPFISKDLNKSIQQ